MNRFTRAHKYHREVMLRKFVRNLGKAVALGIVIALLIPIPQVKAEPQMEISTETYIIADVVELYNVQGNPTCMWMCDGLHLTVEMPNGEIHKWVVSDNIPDEIPTEVVFKTTDIDNFKTYEIVGMR